MKKTLLILVLVLAGCAISPKSPGQGVYIAKQDYLVALRIAVAYESLPRCVATGPAVCSDTVVVDRLRKADDTAVALLDGAEAAVRAGGSNQQMAITAAMRAVSAFMSITKTLGGK